MIMSKSENLDNYNESYNAEFKHNDENMWGLERYANIMKKAIRENQSKSIVSLGIGHHVVSDILSNELNHSVESYDILEGSKAIIDKFVKDEANQDKINVILTYFEDFQTDKKYDIIEMGFVLEHVDDPQEIINKYKNLLSQKGKMFIAVPNATSLHRLIGFEAGLLSDVHNLSEYDLQLGHKRYFDTEILSEMIIKAGLKINNKYGILLKPITTSQMKDLGWNGNVIHALLNLGERFPEISNSILIEAGL
jgi:2-polyprenyl-3-methyl-5-hydroxy-6-metoxy-1,4-benzoquinol methylase